MRWVVSLAVGLLFLAIGITLIVLAPSMPVHYFSEGTSVLSDGTVVPGSFTPSHYEILVPTTPNTLHLRLVGDHDLHVELAGTNGTVIRTWNGSVIDEDYVLSGCGNWEVYVSASTSTHFRGTVYTSASLLAHPALVYASGAILLGILSILYSNGKKKQHRYVKDVLFEQNIGGRWVFAAWLPILYIIAQAPGLIPSFPWLYFTLIVMTVVAVVSCISLAYIKLYVSTEGLFVEAPFLSFSRHYSIDLIYGFETTKEEKQRWFLLHPIRSDPSKKEDAVTITIMKPLPSWLSVVVLGARLVGNRISFRPKSLRQFTEAMDKLGVSKRSAAQV